MSSERVLEELQEIKLAVSSSYLPEARLIDLCINALTLKNSVDLAILRAQSPSELGRLYHLETQVLALYRDITSNLHPNTHPFHISLDADVKNYCSILKMPELVAFSRVNKCCYAIATQGIKLRYRQWYDVEPFDDMSKNLGILNLALGLNGQDLVMDEYVELIQSLSISDFFVQFASNLIPFLLLRKQGEVMPEVWHSLLYLNNLSEASEVLDRLKVFSKLKLDVNWVNSTGVSPLSKAVTVGSLGVVTALLELGADPDQPVSAIVHHSIASNAYVVYCRNESRNESPNLLCILRALFGGTTHKSYRYKDENFFINDAVKRGDLDALKIFIDTNQWPDNFEDLHNPVMQACIRCFKHPEARGLNILRMILDSLIRRQAYIPLYAVLKYCEENKLTQCMEAILSYVESIYPYYIGVLAELNCFDSFKQVVDSIVANGGLEALNTLTQGEFLLSMVCSNDNYAQARYLIDQGIRIDTVDSCGLQPIHRAACGSEEITILLLEHGAKVDTLDSKGKTPLMHAANNSCYSTCEMLLKLGADLSITSKTGKTSLLYALRNFSMAIPRLFLKHGADPDLRKNFILDPS
jgi:ankyrin repeat protein